MHRLILVGVSAFAATDGFAQSTTANSKPEIILGVGHADVVNAVAYAPDGKTVVTGSGDNTLKIWNAENGRLLRTLVGHSSYVHGVDFSPDGRSIVSGSWDGTLKIWDSAGQRAPRTLPLPDARSSTPINAVTWCADGRSIVSSIDAVLASEVMLWDVVSGRLARTMRIDGGAGGSVSITSVACSSDGRTLASASDDNVVRLWDRQNGRLLRSLKGHKSKVSSVAFSRDGRSVVSGSWDGTLKLWDVANGKEIRTISSLGAQVLGVAVSPDGRSIASGDAAGLRLWETASGRELAHLDSSSPSYITGSRPIAFSPDGRALAYIFERVPHIWDTKSGHDLRAAIGYDWPGNKVAAVAFSRDSQFIAAGWGKVVRQWDAGSGRPLRTLSGHGYEVRSVAFAPDGSTIASGSADDTVRLWDATNGRTLRVMSLQGKEDGQVASVAFSPDGRTIVSGGYGEHDVAFWDAATGIVRPTAFLDAHVNGVAFAPDGSMLVSTNLEKLNVWDADGHMLRALRLGTVGWVNAVAVSPDSRTIAWGADWGNLQLWDAASGRALRKLVGHQASVEAVAFSPDGRLVASGGVDNSVRLWDRASGRLLHTLYGHTGTVTGVAFSPDGRSLISGGSDSTIRRWDLAGELLAISVVGNEGDWLTITPEGFFDAAGKGVDAISVVRGHDAWSIDQFYQSLYRPDLVREKLSGDPRGLVREAAARLDLTKVLASGSAPDVQITMPARTPGAPDNIVAVEVEISERGGGIGRIEWRVNGVTAGLDNPAPPAPGQPLRLTRRFVLEPGSSDISVVAYNGANFAASMPAHIRANAAQPTAPLIEKPRLFVLVAGVNDYADKRIALSFAVSDATETARGFKEAAGRLYQSVDVKVMTDAAVTREKLDAAFSEIARKTQPSDVFLLYLAGHGKTVDGRYYFIPQDFSIEGELSEKIMNQSVVAKGIAQDQLQKWFASVPARRSLILFDTCDSGTLVGDDAETQRLEQGAANDRLAQASGRSIITASGGSQEALEGYRGHGLFTYEMLDALNHADGDRNGTIEVTELAAYVYAQVTELSEKTFRQRQTPQIKILSNYPLVKQTRVLRDEVIPVAQAKPGFQLNQTAQLRVQPNVGATVVRSLAPKTQITVLSSANGWSLVASGGNILGYVATRDLPPMQ